MQKTSISTDIDINLKAILRKKKVLSVEIWVFSPGMNPTSFPRDWNSTLEMTQRLSRATLLPWTSDECWPAGLHDIVTQPILSQIFSFSCSKLRSWISGVDLSHIDIIEIRSTLYKRKSAISSSYRYRYSNRFEGPMDRWSLHHSHLAGFILRKKSKSPVILSSSKLNTHHFFFT